MTREEQIKKQANIYIGHPQDLEEDICITNMRNDFIEGAKWADEHPNLYNDELNRKAVLYDEFLEKACEYLRTHLWQNIDDDNDPIIESVHNITLNNFIKDFKRNLEE